VKEREGTPKKPFSNLIALLEAQIAAGAGFKEESLFFKVKNLLDTELAKEGKCFTEEERKILKDDGAKIYPIEGETIQAQMDAGRPFHYVADRVLLLNTPSLVSEMAIYPNPNRFFVSSTLGKKLSKQEKLVKKDASQLRKRLGLKGIDEIIPQEAATVTELLFKHRRGSKSKVWLLGESYRHLRVITKNPTDESGLRVALVSFRFSMGPGLIVETWDRNLGFSDICAIRLIVPKRK